MTSPTSPIAPRLSSVMGVGRALLSTVGPADSVAVLVSEFGWDISMQALAALPGPDAAEAFMRCWETLLTDDIHRELRDVPWTNAWRA